MTYENWRDSYWKFGSSTDELRAQRAWIMARVSLQELVSDLIRDRRSDTHLSKACAFLVEAGQFYKEHPELEPELKNE
jgi:hypothetical protein